MDSESDSDDSVSSTSEYNEAIEAIAKHPKPSTEFFSADRSSWLDSLRTFVNETEISCLDLASKGVGPEDAGSILNFLPGTSVTELNLGGNRLSGSLKVIGELLLKSNINKLSVRACQLNCDDILDLMRILKDSRITDLDVCWNTHALTSKNVKEFVSLLLKSHLTALDVSWISSGDEDVVKPLADTLHKIGLKCLNLSEINMSHKTLFNNLGVTSLTELRLSGLYLNWEEMTVLIQNLNSSKLETLDLSDNRIKDGMAILLGEGLVGSKITVLDLSRNMMYGNNHFYSYLKHTKVKTLNMSTNPIQDPAMISNNFLKNTVLEVLDLGGCAFDDKFGVKLIKCLKNSKLKELSLCGNGLGKKSISEFAKIVKDTNIEAVNFSETSLPSDAFFILGDCIKESKIKHINVSKNKEHLTEAALLSFLNATKNTSVTSVILGNNNVGSFSNESLAQSLHDISFSHLELSGNSLKDSIASLAPHFQFSNITFLGLSGNKLGDSGVIALADCLKETKIDALYVSQNSITSQGAIALAASFKGSRLCDVDLSVNLIDNSGLEALAEHAKGTDITSLNVESNPGNRNLLVESVVLQNRTSVHKRVSFVKQLVQTMKEEKLSSDGVGGNSKSTELSDDHLQVYKTLVDQPIAIHAVAKDESVSLSYEEISKMLFKDFPRQLSQSIRKDLKVDVLQHVNFLRKSEEQGLVRIVESLLSNPTLFLIDEVEKILHPYVYKLLIKYKNLVELSVDLVDKNRIVEYFKKHLEVEGALEIVNLL